ncbi:MAG: DUF3299 domain-containing protein [Pseudomonadota bacterium]|nr:DUF3299 domain-containing protein [Pseudomonadota bacterium]
MKRILRQIAIFTCISAFSCGATLSAAEYEEIEWTALMPASDLAALLDPPDYLSNVKDGSQQDSVKAFTQNSFEDEKTERFKQALSSVQVIPEFDGRSIKIPGYVVPLQQNEEKLVTEFFIVPYFGACLHMPPPPPNQIIYVSYEQGLKLEDLQQPFWFEGEVDIQTRQHELGTAAYTLNVDRYELFE